MNEQSIADGAEVAEEKRAKNPQSTLTVQIKDQKQFVEWSKMESLFKGNTKA